MRLLILHQAGVFGGAERTTHNLLTHLDRQVVSHLTLAAPDALRAFMPERFDEFINTVSLIRHGWFHDIPSLRADVKATEALLRQARPDVVLGMMHYSAALVTFAARRLEKPPKVVGSFRGPIFEYIRRYERGFLRRLFLHTAITLTARLADCILVPSQGTGRDTRWRFFGTAKRIQVIPNGIDGALVRQAAEAPAPGMEQLPQNMPRLCVAARLSEEKDIHLVIEAMNRIRDQYPCSLIIVGEGPEREALANRVRELSLADRVVFAGYRENVFPYLGRADLYVHTCQFEGFGYAMLEAMACGTPVIATDCPHGPREVLSGGRDGVLVAPGNASALAAAIAAILGDPERQRQLVERGLRRAEELSVRNMAERYQSLFQNLVAT
ncbi:MAG: glycosyltransferase [Chromatiaceae bacterium]